MSEDQKKQLTYVAVGAAACAALYFGYKHCAGASEGGAKSPKKSPYSIFSFRRNYYYFFKKIS